MVSLCVIFGGYMYNLDFVHTIRIRFMPRFSSYYSKRPVIIFIILFRMFRPDQYPGLDDYYEQKHRAVLVERGEVIMILLMIIFIYSMICIFSQVEPINKLCLCLFRFLHYFV